MPTTQLEFDIPTQSELLLPTLEVLNDLGGHAPAATVIDELTERLKIPDAVRNYSHVVQAGRWGTRRRFPWRHQIHRVRMNAVYAGKIRMGKYGYWTLTDEAKDQVLNARPGIILTVYETPSGQVLWADAMTAAGSFENGTINLAFSSMPYPNVKRSYGRFTEAEIIEMTVKYARLVREALRDDGSLVLNFKDVWQPHSETGGCVRSVYQEKLILALVGDLKLFLADKFVWKNPSHLPDSPWVTIRKVRTAMDHENLFWFSKGPNPKADNRNVLVDPAPATIATYLRKAQRKALNRIGPSGQNNTFEEQVAAVAAGQSIKVIPRNVLEISNANTHSTLRKTLAELGLPRHDAMMPLELARHFVRFLTDPGDIVFDGFHGSGTTLLAAATEGRYGIGSDINLAHILASAPRQQGVTYNPLLAA